MRRERIVVGGELLPYCALGRLAEIVAHGLQALDCLSVGLHAFKVQEDFGSKLMDGSREMLTEQKPNLIVHSLGELVRTAPDFNAVVFTMWETSMLKLDCVRWLNQVRAIVVPTQWNKKAFVKSGVKVPIFVVPLGVDTKVFRSDLKTFPKRVFLTAGRSAHGVERKGLDTVMLAFLLAFPTERDVVLQVKTHPDCPVMDMQCSRIQVIKAHLSEADLVRWYREGLCYVSGAMGEGWGLHQHEAMACGKPVISVNYGGVTGFFRPGAHGWAVKHTLVEPSDLVGVWAKPSIDSIAKAMRAVYEAPYVAFLRGLQAAQDVQRLSTENMIKGLYDVLHKTVLSRR